MFLFSVLYNLTMVQERNTRNIHEYIRVRSPIFNVERTSVGRGLDRSRRGCHHALLRILAIEFEHYPQLHHSACSNPIEKSADLHLPDALSPLVYQNDFFLRVSKRIWRACLKIHDASEWCKSKIFVYAYRSRITMFEKVG